MSAQYPSVNDREFDLLKKLANNTGIIAEDGGGGGGGDVFLAGNNVFTGSNQFKAALRSDIITFPAGSPGLELYATVDEVDFQKLVVGTDAGRFLIASTQGSLFNDAKSLAIQIQGNGTSYSTIYMNKPNTAGQTPAMQFWVTDLNQERQDGVFHFYTAGGAKLSQSTGQNRFIEISPRYAQTGDAEAVDLDTNRTVDSLGTGLQRLLRLRVNNAEQFGVDDSGKIQVLKTLSAPPASATAAGVAGTITWDASFIYICVATNTWKRVAIATW